MGETVLCREADCGRAFTWRNHVKSGKAAPVDVIPDPNGNIELVGDSQYRVLTKLQRNAAQQGSLMDGPPELFTLHFATCTHPERWRRCSKCHKAPCACR